VNYHYRFGNIIYWNIYLDKLAVAGKQVHAFHMAPEKLDTLTDEDDEYDDYTRNFKQERIRITSIHSLRL
jgi:hypothetical protein